MTVSVNVETGRRDRALVIPNDALERDGRGGAQVWKVTGGRIARVPVSLGLRGITVTEVTDGLVEGDVVLSAPGATLADGDRVRPQLGAIPSEHADTSTDRELPVKFD